MALPVRLRTFLKGHSSSWAPRGVPGAVGGPGWLPSFQLCPVLLPSLRPTDAIPRVFPSTSPWHQPPGRSPPPGKGNFGPDLHPLSTLRPGSVTPRPQHDRKTHKASSLKSRTNLTARCGALAKQVWGLRGGVVTQGLRTHGATNDVFIHNSGTRKSYLWWVTGTHHSKIIKSMKDVMALESANIPVNK